MILKFDSAFLCVGGSEKGSTTPTSSAKKPKVKEEPKREEEKKKDEKPKQTAFPPVNTTDAVRLKCRELLLNALKTDNPGIHCYLKCFSKGVHPFNVCPNNIFLSR